jgi:TonB family protein
MRYFRVLIISLLFHLLLGIALVLMPKAPRLETHPPAYVDLLEKPELARRPHQESHDEKQFVRSVQVPDKLLAKVKRDARFASEEDRTVIEEQKARVSDMTANRTLEVPLQQKSNQKSLAKNSAKVRSHARDKLDLSPESLLDKVKDELRTGKLGPGDIAVGGLEEKKSAARSESQPLTPSFGGVERGVSTLGEAVPDDIKYGDFTALNTDRHLYYSFYARMEEKIRHRWVTYARAAVYNMPADPRKMTGKDSFVTKLEVILDPKGNFVRAILHESSGVQSLDSAPVQAFKDAGQFPNPPAEMVKEDGAIHIYYAFNVSMSPGDVAGRD